MKDYIIGIGEALWDIFPGGKKLGGAPANFAYHVSQFGLNGLAVSAVGNDALGAEMLELFAEKGLECLIAEVPFQTGFVNIEVDEAGIPQYVFAENTAWDNIPFTPQLEEIAHHTRAVCFGSLAQRGAVSRQTIRRFLDSMPKRDDILTVFDVNLRQEFYSADIIRDSLRRCNVLKINDEELPVVSSLLNCESQDFKATCRQIMTEFGLNILILTCGVNGSYVFTPEEVSFQSTPQVEVVDTVGAGDSFTAAFIASIIKGKSIAEAHQIAVKTSAFVCTQAGAMPVLTQELI